MTMRPMRGSMWGMPAEDLGCEPRWVQKPGGPFMSHQCTTVMSGAEKGRTGVREARLEKTAIIREDGMNLGQVEVPG